MVTGWSSLWKPVCSVIICYNKKSTRVPGLSPVFRLCLAGIAHLLYPPQTLFVGGIIPPQTLFVGGLLFSRCPSVCPSIRPSVTLCFLNNSKSHCRIFIKPCKHVHICKTNTLDKKVRARGQFY